MCFYLQLHKRGACSGMCSIGVQAPALCAPVRRCGCVHTTRRTPAPDRFQFHTLYSTYAGTRYCTVVTTVKNWPSPSA